MPSHGIPSLGQQPVRDPWWVAPAFLVGWALVAFFQVDVLYHDAWAVLKANHHWAQLQGIVVRATLEFCALASADLLFYAYQHNALRPRPRQLPYGLVHPHLTVAGCALAFVDLVWQWYISPSGIPASSVIYLVWAMLNGLLLQSRIFRSLVDFGLSFSVVEGPTWLPHVAVQTLLAVCSTFLTTHLQRVAFKRTILLMPFGLRRTSFSLYVLWRSLHAYRRGWQIW